MSSVLVGDVDVIVMCDINKNYRLANSVYTTNENYLKHSLLTHVSNYEYTFGQGDIQSTFGIIV
jgi:hypothetical protein